MTAALDVVAVPTAVGAALSFALSAVLQQRETADVPERRALDPRLVLDLVHRPVWAASIAADIVGVVLQVIALHFGQLILVQPLLVAGLLFAVVIAARLDHRPPDRVMLGGALLCAAGLTAFLLVAQPAGGDGTARGVDARWLVIGLAATLASCLLVAYRTGGTPRALALALGTGLLYGVTSGLLKLLGTDLASGVAATVTHWPLYAVLVAGPLGFLLSQNAFQAARLPAPPLAVLTTVDPLVSIAIGLVALGERIEQTPGAVVGEVLALTAMTGGIYALAHRAPAVVAAGEQAAPGPRDADAPIPSGASGRSTTSP